MSKKNQRQVQMHVELRKSAGEVIKPEKAKVDLYALVESRTGLVLRWSQRPERLQLEVERGTRYY